MVDSEGRISGVNINQQHITGSLVKAMLLVAYLRRLGRMGQKTVDSYSNSFLQPMIEISDNNAATHAGTSSATRASTRSPTPRG